MIPGQHTGKTTEVTRSNHRRCRCVVDLARGSDQIHRNGSWSDGADRGTDAREYITGAIHNLVVGVVESHRNGDEFARSSIRISEDSRSHWIEGHMITRQHAGQTAEVARSNHRRCRCVVDLARGSDQIQ